MNRKTLKKAFRKSDFDKDGYLNSFELEQLGVLLFGHLGHGALYEDMCDFASADPRIGLTLAHVNCIFASQSEEGKCDESKEECEDSNASLKRARKKKRRKKRKKKSKRSKRQLEGSFAAMEVSLEERSGEHLAGKQSTVSALPAYFLGINDDLLESAPQLPDEVSDEVSAESRQSTDCTKKDASHRQHFKSDTAVVMSALVSSSDDQSADGSKTKKKEAYHWLDSGPPMEVMTADKCIQVDTGGVEEVVTEIRVHTKQLTAGELQDMRQTAADDLLQSQWYEDVVFDVREQMERELKEEETDDGGVVADGSEQESEGLKECLEQKAMEVMQWKDRFKEFEQQKANRINQLAKARKSMAELQSALRSERESKQTLGEDRDALAQKSAEMQAEIQLLKEAIEAQKLSDERLTAETRQKHSELEELRTRMEAVQSQYETESDAWCAERQSLRRELTHATEALKDSQSQIEQMGTKVAVATRRPQSASTVSTTSSSSSKTELAIDLDTGGTKNERIGALQLQVTDLEFALKRAESRVDEMQHKHKHERDSLNAAHFKRVAELTYAGKKEEHLHSQALDEMKRKAKESREIARQWQERSDELRRRMAALSDELDAATKRAVAAEDESRTLKLHPSARYVAIGTADISEEKAFSETSLKKMATKQSAISAVVSSTSATATTTATVADAKIASSYQSAGALVTASTGRMKSGKAEFIRRSSQSAIRSLLSDLDPDTATGDAETGDVRLMEDTKKKKKVKASMMDYIVEEASHRVEADAMAQATASGSVVKGHLDVQQSAAAAMDDDLTRVASMESDLSSPKNEEMTDHEYFLMKMAQMGSGSD